MANADLANGMHAPHLVRGGSGLINRRIGQIPFPGFAFFIVKTLNFFIFRYEKSGEQSAFFLRLIDALNFSIAYEIA